jgi:hypothetical protein
MPVIESTATALVRFTGLGIICFNKEGQRGEIAAIRDNKHSLTIKIQQPVYQDGAEKDIIVYKDIATYKQLPKEDVEIEIKAGSAPAIEGFEIYQNGDFDRLASADVNDFRWIVSMSDLHGQTDLRPTGEERYPITKIFIGNGLFYAHKLDRKLFFEKVERDASGAARQREVFGHVAETIGVKIEGEEVSFTIRIGTQEETHTLKRVQGLPFRIEFANMDHSANAIYSDMPDYYKYVSSPTGTKFDLVPVAEETDGEASLGGAINQEEFCHPIKVDNPSTINQL